MFHLNLITLSGKRLDEDVFELVVPTTAGAIAINQDHAPLLGAVAPGVLYVRKKRETRESDREQFGVYNGTVEVLNNIVSVLVDEVDTPEDIVASEAEAAYKRAKDLKDKAGDAVSLSEAQALIDRQAVRLKLAGLKKSSKKRY